MEELGLDYEVKHYKRNRKTNLAPKELKQIHPLGKSPALTDGDRVIAESGAIVEYLVERHGEGRMRPEAGSEEELRYRYWLHYAEGTLMPLLVISLIFRQVEKAPLVVRPLTKAISSQVNKAYLGPNLRTNLEFIEAELDKSTWFAGEELSAADVMMSFPLQALVAQSGKKFKTGPKTKAFVERLEALPGWQRSVERVGPLEFFD